MLHHAPVSPAANAMQLYRSEGSSTILNPWAASLGNRSASSSVPSDASMIPVPTQPSLLDRCDVAVVRRVDRVGLGDGVQRAVPMSAPDPHAFQDQGYDGIPSPTIATWAGPESATAPQPTCPGYRGHNTGPGSGTAIPPTAVCRTIEAIAGGLGSGRYRGGRHPRRSSRRCGRSCAHRPCVAGAAAAETANDLASRPRATNGLMDCRLWRRTPGQRF